MSAVRLGAAKSGAAMLSAAFAWDFEMASGDFLGIGSGAEKAG